jgi:transposase
MLRLLRAIATHRAAHRQVCKQSTPADFEVVQAIRCAIRATGAKLLYQPPYSPDLNPIEQLFAKLKTLLRKAVERTLEVTLN